jgi:hypothetical protein
LCDYSQMENWWENLMRVYAEQGYLVVGATSPLRPGHVVGHINDWGLCQELPQPFAVVQEATPQEFTLQAKKLGFQPGDPTLPCFYRMVTD